MKVISMRGQVVDMAQLAAENAKQVALGNASMNARGDLLGSGGKVLKTREDITREYYSDNPKAVRQMSLRDIKREVFVSPSEAVATATEQGIILADDKGRKRKIVD